MDYLMLSYQTAFRYWVCGHSKRMPQAIKFDIGNKDNLVITGNIKRLPQMIPSELTPSAGKIDLLVTKPESRSHSSKVTSHVWLGDLPRGCVCKISDSLLVASPEFLYVLLAQKATLPELIAYGTSLCSSYPLEHLPRSQRVRKNTLSEPLTTKAQITQLLNDLPYRNGVAKAKRALPWISEGAASVREAELAILMRPPFRHGGDGLPPAELNARITLSGAAEKMFGNSYCYPDFLWRDKKLILEYDSNEHHSSKFQMQKDARKRNALAYMGYDVLTYTNEIFSSYQKRTAMITQLRELLIPNGDKPNRPNFAEQKALFIAARNIPRGIV